MLKHGRKRFTYFGMVVIAISTVALGGCAPPVYEVQPSQRPSPPSPSVDIYFYPNHGQSREQQKRDRYECYLWAVKKTGFDPAQANLAPHQRVEVKPASPPGSGAAAGAVAGAIIGSIFSMPREQGEGMVSGAIAGAMLGAASDQAKQQQADRMQQHYNAEYDRRYARLDRQARNYRRAMTACLVGRGYTVR